MSNLEYRHGFEDALELCIAETANAESKEKATAKMEEYLGLAKEYKLERLREMIFSIKDASEEEK